jgi:clan AA aspartic protease
MATKKTERVQPEVITFSVEIGVGNFDNGPKTRVLAMVDTGSFNSLLPASLLRRLGLEPLEQETYTMADGSEVEYGLGVAGIGIDGREWPCPVVFGPDGQYLLGATTLEIFRLMVDPVDEQLIRKPPQRARPI